MRLTVNTTAHIDPDQAVTISSGDTLLIEWDATSKTGGFGRDPLGQETAGFGAGIPQDVFYTVVEIHDEEGTVTESDPILPPFGRFYYYALDNMEDHGGSYQTDMELRVIQVSADGRRTEAGRVVTT